MKIIKFTFILLCFSLLPNVYAQNNLIEIFEAMEFKVKTIVGKINISDIEDLNDLPVKLGDNPGDAKLEMWKENSPTKMIQTCKEYNEAKEKGFEASTTFSLSMESFFKKACFLIKIMAKAKPLPETSQNIKLNNLSVLPVSLIPNPTGSSRKTLKQQNLKGNNLADYVKWDSFKVISSSEEKLEFVFNEMGSILSSVARADFDGSGQEQLLVFKADYATNGSFRNYNYYVLKSQATSVVQAQLIK